MKNKGSGCHKYDNMDLINGCYSYNMLFLNLSRILLLTSPVNLSLQHN